MTTDPNITTYVAYQDGVRTSLGLPASWQDSAGIAGNGTNSVIGWTAGTTALPSGTNTVLLDEPHSDYALQIDGSGNLVIKDIGSGDANNGQSITVTGDSYVIFNGGSAATAGVYDQAMIIESGTTATIARLYDAVLGRLPDLPGLEQWVNAYKTGAMTLSQIEQGFVGSQEFATHYGANLTDTAFVTSLYQNTLDRAPDQTGLNGWLSSIASAEAGGASQLAARAQVVDGFMTSQEFINDTASWLVDTQTGGYVDSGMQLPASTVLSQAVSSGYLNTNLMATPSNGFVQTPGFSSSGNNTGYQIGTSNATFLTANVNNATIVDGTTNVALIYGNNDTIYNSSATTSIVINGNYNTVILSSPTTTTIQSQFPYLSTSGYLIVPTNTSIYDFIPGTDKFESTLQYANLVHNYGITTTILDASGGQHFNGASLNFSTNTYILDVGNVGGGTAAEVATAINNVYTLGEIASSNPSKSGENLTVIGQASNGNTVVYDFANWQNNGNGVFYPSGNPDIHGTHQVTADELSFAATLVGISTSSLTTHDL